MFFSLRLQQFNSAKAVLKRGNANPNKESRSFSDTGDNLLYNVYYNNIYK
jgi:hypothetical protein